MLSYHTGFRATLLGNSPSTQSVLCAWAEMHVQPYLPRRSCKATLLFTSSIWRHNTILFSWWYVHLNVFILIVGYTTFSFLFHLPLKVMVYGHVCPHLDNRPHSVSKSRQGYNHSNQFGTQISLYILEVGTFYLMATIMSPCVLNSKSWYSTTIQSNSITLTED